MTAVCNKNYRKQGRKQRQSSDCTWKALIDVQPSIEGLLKFRDEGRKMTERRCHGTWKSPPLQEHRLNVRRTLSSITALFHNHFYAIVFMQLLGQQKKLISMQDKQIDCSVCDQVSFLDLAHGNSDLFFAFIFIVISLSYFLSYGYSQDRLMLSHYYSGFADLLCVLLITFQCYVL